MLYALCFMLYALCFMLYALCFMLYALCFVLYALCFMLLCDKLLANSGILCAEQLTSRTVLHGKCSRESLGYARLSG